MSSSEGYILNAVQTPRSLLPVYRSIAGGSTTKEAIQTDTDIGSNLDATLDGLRLLRLIGREEEAYYAEPFRWEVKNEYKSFQMTALHNLVQECDPDNWGKQAAVLLNYWHLLNNNRQYFQNNDSALYEAIDTWYNSLGYEPRSQQGIIKHNDPKFGNWTRLVEYLGLVHKISGREYTAYPDPEIMLRSVELACSEVGTNIDGSPTVEIEQYLEWLRENLLYVKFTPDGDIPTPLARVLFELIRDGHIEAREYGDAGHVGFSGVPPYEGMDRAANTLRVK
jgi:hypothetical protein